MRLVLIQLFVEVQEGPRPADTQRRFLTQFKLKNLLKQNADPRSFLMYLRFFKAELERLDAKSFALLPKVKMTPVMIHFDKRCITKLDPNIGVARVTDIVDLRHFCLHNAQNRGELPAHTSIASNGKTTSVSFVTSDVGGRMTVAANGWQKSNPDTQHKVNVSNVRVSDRPTSVCRLCSTHKQERTRLI